MYLQGLLVGIVTVIFAAALYMAYKCGGKAAQLDAARAQARQQEKERQYVQKVLERVSALSLDDVQHRLQDITHKQR